jgi:hypothetical protein
MGDPLLGTPLLNSYPEADFPDRTKPPNVYRIVMLGDSHTASVRNELSYAKILQALLNKEDLKGKRVEVHNAGTPGHSHYQYFLTLKERLSGFRPDLAIIGFYIGNDFLDLYRNDDRPSLFYDGRQFVHRTPEFLKYTDPGGSEWLRSSPLAKVASFYFRRTIGYEWGRVQALWAVGAHSGQGFGAAMRYLYTISRGYFIDQHIFRQSMNQILFLKSFPKEQAVIVRVNRKVTELIKEFADREHIRLLYVPIPTQLQIVPNQDREVLNQVLQLCGYGREVLSLEDQLNEQFVSLLGQYGIEALDVKAPLRARANSDRL